MCKSLFIYYKVVKWNFKFLFLVTSICIFDIKKHHILIMGYNSVG